MVEIKDRLNEALQIRNMTANELAKQSGLNKGSISKYRRGDIVPKQNAIAAMARALTVSPAWLMGYDVLMEPSHIVETMPEGTYRIGEQKPDIWLDFESLSENNKKQVASYIQFLKKQEEGDNE